MKNSGLIVLLALMLCCLGNDDSIDKQDFTGVLTVKADSSQSQEGTSIKVTAPIYSSKLKNINHQTIRVVVASPIDACTPLDEFSSTDNYPIYYLVQGGQGSCTYARKCEMAKKAMARGIIIVDSSTAINNLNFRNTDNDKFITLLIDQDESKRITGKKLIAELTMTSTDKKKAIMEIWVSSLNRDSYNTLDWWRDIVSEISSLSSAVSWKPRFAYYPCITENICGNEFVSSCACGGEFCSPEAHGMSSNPLIREDIRQHIIFQKHPDKYLTYVNKFKKQCLESYISTRYVEDCSSSILEELQLANTEINNFIDLFLSSCDASDGEDIFNLYQAMTLDRNKYRQIGHYPSIILNHQQLQFKNKDDLKSLICRKLSLEQQSGCLSQKTTVMEGIITWLFYFITISLLLGVGAFVVIFFRNRLRREMNKQLKMQVSTAVEHYFSLSETNR